jgi:signal transduction histidine kinase
MRRAGLRWRLVAACVATSAATLVAAGVALLPPLEHRLTTDRIHMARQRIRDDRAVIAAAAVGRGPAPLEPAARALARRIGARVQMLGGTPVRVLADSDPRAALPGDAATIAQSLPTAAGPVDVVARKPLQDTHAADGVVRQALPVAAGFGLLVAIVVGLLLATRLLVRVRRLRDGAQRIASGGLADPLPDDRSGDELGELSRALESMRAQLSADARSRQAFVATASHELRTPLTSLRTALELLDEEVRRPGVDVEQIRARTALARDQVASLTQLAEDLLDLSRVDAESPLRSEPVDVGALAQIAARELDPGGDRVTVSADGPAVALADPAATMRVLRTLLSNALAYGPAAAPVLAEAWADADTGRVRLRVRDGGAGIAAADRERIFARFERGAASVGTVGFGLGLPISRALARRMGGDLWLDSTAATTTFVLDLPCNDEGRPLRAPLVVLRVESG